jgi:hypothetical protein
MARRYAPALTRQAFRVARPKGNYATYLKYLQRNRPGWDPQRPNVAQRVGPPKRGALPSYESLLRGMSFETPAQIEARANRMAQTQFKLGRSEAMDMYNQARADAERRFRLFSEAGQRAATANAGLIGLVGSGYREGADQLSALASAGSSMMAGGTDAAVASANAALGNVGMPGVEVGGPVGGPGLAGATQAGVENFRGGTLPSQALQTAGGFASAKMQGQLSSQVLRADQESKLAYMQAMSDATKARESALKELRRGRPALAGEYLLKLQDAQRQQIALAQGLLGASTQKGELIFQRGVTQEGIKQRWTELGISRDTYETNKKQIEASMDNAQTEADRTGREIDEAGSIARGWYIDKQGRWVLDKKGKRIKVPDSIRQGGTSGTAQTPAKTKQDMAAQAHYWLQDHVTSKGKLTGTKQQLVNYLLALFPGNAGLAKAIAEAVWPQAQTTGGTLGNQPGG